MNACIPGDSCVPDRRSGIRLRIGASGGSLPAGVIIRGSGDTLEQIAKLFQVSVFADHGLERHESHAPVLAGQRLRSGCPPQLTAPPPQCPDRAGSRTAPFVHAYQPRRLSHWISGRSGVHRGCGDRCPSPGASHRRCIQGAAPFSYVNDKLKERFDPLATRWVTATMRERLFSRRLDAVKPCEPRNQRCAARGRPASPRRPRAGEMSWAFHRTLLRATGTIDQLRPGQLRPSLLRRHANRLPQCGGLCRDVVTASGPHTDRGRSPRAQPSGPTNATRVRTPIQRSRTCNYSTFSVRSRLVMPYALFGPAAR